MSLSTLATTSFSSAHDADLPPSAFELRHVLLDHQSVETVNEVFGDDATSLSQLRHVSYIAQNIIRLQWELERHESEEQDLYKHIMKNEEFRNTLQPVVHDFRRRTRTKGFHPYTNQRLSHTPPPLSSSSGSSKDQPPSPKSQKSDHSSSSASNSSTSYSSGMSLINAYLEQERLRQLPGSSPKFPITIEIPDEEEEPVNASLPPSQPSPETAYNQRMRLRRPSMVPTYRPTCERCGLVGHEKPDCQTPNRHFLRCEFCTWLKQPQRLCKHHYMSDYAQQRLRRRMRLPENPD